MTNQDQFQHAGKLVSRQLYLIIVLFVVITTLLLGLDRFQAQILDSVRVYVAAEGYWSKGQKDAIYNLVRYASSHDESALNAFHDGIAVSLGDRQARLALQAKPVNIKLAREGFLRGRNHINDVDKMIWLFRNFGGYGDMKKAIAIWTEGDKHIDELLGLEQELEQLIHSGKADKDRIHAILLRVDAMNERVTELENRFSATLGNAARKIKQLTSLLILSSTVFLLLIGILLSRRIVKSIRGTQVALIESEARFRHVVESNIAGIMFWQRDGAITDANDALLEIIGYSRQDLRHGKINWQTITPEESQAVDARAMDEIHRQGFCTPYEKEYLRKDGQRVSVYVSAASFEATRDRGVCFVIDISEKKRAEQAQKLAATVFHSAKEAIMVTDHSAAIQVVNPAFTQISGYEAAEVMGKNPNILSSGEHEPAFFGAMWQSLQESGSWKGEIWNKRKNGELYQALLSISAIYDDNHNVTRYVAIFSDITEQRRLEDQLKQSQKMEAIGTLVGGIAHDFNNTLAAIQGNLYLAQKYNQGNEAVSTKLDVIDQLGKHSAKIIQQLLTFARKGNVQMAPISLNTLFAGLERLTRSFIPENIAFDIKTSDQPLTVKGDMTQLQQIMLNLFNNAVDAVADKAQPQVECRLEAMSADDLFMREHPWLESNQLAHIHVHDNGCGIPEENLQHIFEPFFTTKEVGKGTGLGMAMVYGSIQTHHGAIDIESKPDEGTSIHLYLSRVQTQADKVPETTSKEHKLHNTRSVLLVDDYINVRDTYAEALASMGYQVITANDGLDALACFEQHGDNIDIVVSDIVMPKMSGFHAVERMRMQRPELPVIFMTGYDPQTNVPGNLRANSQMLSKPFSIVELAEQIQQMLNPGNAES